MRRVIAFCLFFVALLAAQPVEAQVPNGIITSLRQGNAQELSDFFGGYVELYMEDKGDVYSKAQTVRILKHFFDQHHPTNLQVIHQSGKKAHQYVILTLETAAGNYQVSVLMCQLGEQSLVSQLQIEESEV